MRGKSIRGAWLLAAWLTLLPALVRAQSPGYAPADGQLPIPLGSTRPEDGGLYLAAQALFFHQNIPLKSQLLAIRGFQASDNSIPTGFIGGTQASQLLVNVNSVNNALPVILATLPAGTTVLQEFDQTTTVAINGVVTTTTPVAILFSLPAQAAFATGFLPVGAFVGNGQAALDVKDLTGRDSYQPGTELTIGWKFKDGSSVAFNWLYIAEANYRTGASLAPPNGVVGGQLQNTFLFSPVFNFPPEFSGANFKVSLFQPTNLNVQGIPIPQPNPQAVFGIWNGASIMTLQFRQRFQQYEIAYREPIYETDDYRLSGIVGPRFAWEWEKFKWTTTSIGFDASTGIIQNGPDNVGIYSAVTSNRMYGLHAGCEQECYLGHGFAVNFKTEGALFMDAVKEYAKYETEAKFSNLPANKKARRVWAIVPELQATLGMMWYPTEFIQVYAGYEVMAFFNTQALRKPVDFDYSNVSPTWTNFTRYFDGWRAGFAITF
jgi:hypothetical protein